MKGHLIASGTPPGGFGAATEFWLIGGHVYVSREGDAKDIHGLPNTRRWECPLWHWNHYRANWSWAKDANIVDLTEALKSSLKSPRRH